MRERKWDIAYVLQGRNLEYTRTWEDLEIENTWEDIKYDARETKKISSYRNWQFRIIRRRVPYGTI